MSGTEQRRVAVETLVEFGHGYADTMAELDCPHRQTLRDRWEGYGSTGRVPTGKGRTPASRAIRASQAHWHPQGLRRGTHGLNDT